MFEILKFYLNCDYCNQQEELLQEHPLLIATRIVDVENEDDILQKYHVNRLPKFILIDSDGNEIKRWEGITQPQEINDYLADHGYVKAKPQLDDSILNKINQVDMKLASNFMVESMLGMDYTPKSGLSDDVYIAQLQQQYSHFCLKANSNIIMDTIDKSVAHPIVSALKQHLMEYVADDSHRNNPAMKWLYNESNRNTLIQQIGMLTVHALIRNSKDIHNLTREEMHCLMDPENVTLIIGFYTYFTIIVNKNIHVEDFNQLFCETWYKYFESLQARILMFRMRGNLWKTDFEDVLFSI